MLRRYRQPMMTVRILIILLLIEIVFICNSFGQTYSTVTSDNEIYAFLNWMTRTEEKHGEEPKLGRKKIAYQILAWDSANFVLNNSDSLLYKEIPLPPFQNIFLFQKSTKNDTIFNQIERTFIFQQFTSIKDTIWHTSFSKSKLLTRIKQNKPNRYYYSIPLFTIDRKYVIINKEYYCGNLCAYGGYYIYKKIADGKWEYVTAVHTWIS